jgi:hypothetical protein
MTSDSRPRLLSLFCGCVSDAGWKAVGFHVTGVDHRSQPRASCDTFILADALEYVAAHTDASTMRLSPARRVRRIVDDGVK